MSLLSKIQKELKAPKNQHSEFGNYNYRSCEDILTAVKAILPDNATVVLSDEVVEIGGQIYVKSFAELSDGETVSRAYGYARETMEKKKYDSSQLTGSASSYARKYALNGLFAIDDTKDADATNDIDNNPKKKPARSKDQVDADAKKKYEDILAELDGCADDAAIDACVEKNKAAMDYMAKNYKHYHEDLVKKGTEVRSNVKEK